MKRLLATTMGVLLAAFAQGQSSLPFEVETVTSFDEPWAMAFLPDGRMLVTEKKGNLLIVTRDGQKTRAVGGERACVSELRRGRQARHARRRGRTRCAA
jgi:glucose/arabinose dehydrogenase